MSRSRNAGFSLIELLVVVAIIGIVSTVAIPALVNALDRGRQKRTMADIRALSNALEAYSIDMDRYPQVNSIGAAVALITPDYIRATVTADGWNNSFVYDATLTTYTLGSTGKDGGASLVLIGGGGPTHNINDDIIYTSGQFRQWPEGVQN